VRWTVVALALLAAGCREKKPAEGEPPPPATELMAQGEAEVGKAACNAYVEQVCGCVDKMADLQEECELSRARPDAFEMNTRAAMAQGDANTKDRRALIANARKIMRSCIEDAAALAKKGCPMKATGGGPAPATPAPPAPAPGK
jgi:hypothetical protein